jgi:hypothetical protein
MILDEFIGVKWCLYSKNHYIEKGYVFTKIGDKFIIKIDDLCKCSHILVRAKCDICNHEKLIRYREYYNNIKKGNYFACSRKCSTYKKIKTNLKKYGVACTLQNKEVIKKIKETNIRKYGVENPSQNKEVKEKRKQTNLKRYGFDSYSKTKECKNKIKESSLEKYGVSCTLHNKEVNKKMRKNNLKKYGFDSYSKTKEFKEKYKQTSLIKYGTENPLQNKEIKEKRKQSILLKYGCENTSQLKDVKDKRKKTMIKRYGVGTPFQNKEIREKAKKTNLKRYGFEYPSQNKLVSEKIVNTMIERYGELWLKHTPRYNSNSIIYLDIISEILSIPIQHALNGGEKKFIRYWVDGYIEKYNICIEWDENHHKIKKANDKDILRENYLKEKHNCHIIRINEKEFLKDIDNQINIVCNKINNIINLINIPI